MGGPTYPPHFSNKKVDAAFAGFFAAMVRYGFLAATIISALGAVGVQTTSLVAIFASAGLAVGLALQGSLTNFASGVLILFFRPFDLGHRVILAGKSGVVQDIGLFATTLLTADNEIVIVPNTAITSASIVNSSTKGNVRGRIAVGIPLGAWARPQTAAADTGIRSGGEVAAFAASASGATAVEIDQLIGMLSAAAKRAPHVAEKPGPAVVFAGIAAGTFEFFIDAWGPAGDLGDAGWDSANCRRRPENGEYRRLAGPRRPTGLTSRSSPGQRCRDRSKSRRPCSPRHARKSPTSKGALRR